MKKTHIFILVTITVILCIMVWAIGYLYLFNRVNNAEIREFVESSKHFLESEENFIDAYGSILTFETSSETIMNEKNDDNIKKYYMDFFCITDTGEYHIRVYQIWADGWIFQYKELSPDS